MREQWMISRAVTHIFSRHINYYWIVQNEQQRNKTEHKKERISKKLNETSPTSIQFYGRMADIAR